MNKLLPIAVATQLSVAQITFAQIIPDDDVTELANYTVYGRADPLIDIATTASQGQVGAGELAARPFLRRGELLEVIPGLVVTQHSGGGKANQYFLRGFNLDHGTDFAVSADGMPVNMRTHGHGQGYADVNFIIPELVDTIAFNKGPFFADVGDFSAAGAADIRFVTELPENFLTASAGQDDFYRIVAGMTSSVQDASLTVGGELSTYDGPFLLSEDLRRVNGFLRYHRETDERSLSFTALAYDASWNSTDHIPLRLVDQGSLPRLGTIDPSDGGESSRYSATIAAAWRDGDTTTQTSAYATRYRLDLFSNFTYFLDDPVGGDQFEQFDDRWIAGGTLERSWRPTGKNRRDMRLAAGLQWRSDFIDEVGLHRARERIRTSTVRSDKVREHSLGAYLRQETKWSESWRTVASLRGDYFAFDVASDLAANSGSADDFIASPKLSIIYSAPSNTEIYLSAGTGFHSNDARGTTITIDPASGESADAVDPLVRSKSAEAGLRFAGIKGLVSTVSVFYLELESELLFVGDAGSTEASGATRRYGLELANFHQPLPWLAFDADLALTHARFKNAPGEDRIPGAIDTAISAGMIVGRNDGWFGGLRTRYFGPRTLTEDGSVEGESSLLFNARVGWRGEGWEIALDVLNVFNREDNDIEYYYESRLAGEPAEGVSDIHFHPVEPRTLRLSATRRF